ncbi:MAG: hypothetical protein HEQ13_11270 [Dolichospermum sp. DEX189]|jgi:hypothetical protein|uniref:Uncharacterized protein n=1 Tax=Aphanizomenon flos-aquae FACHB-1040 TaxID=2692887 RepID=A0ABR8BUB4_APHFL|nr:hypothetical protein [Aphanizomenon flos-aquae]MBD2277645.1 hypothetical protein [Aphanizomenon flos-aquae FACHB-1040]MBO1069907.1 hypothetical protein [Dolichospermum sp. DEX189]
MANATLRYQEVGAQGLRPFRSSGGRRKKKEERKIVFTNSLFPAMH